MVPFTKVGFGLDSISNIFRKIGKERHARDAFYLTDAVHIKVLGSGTIRIATNETNAFGGAIEAENHLEEGFRYDNLVGSNRFVFLSKKDGATDDIDVAILLCPSATRHLNLVPHATVQIGMLRTAVGEKEGVVHGISIPFVVTSRAHVATGPIGIPEIC